MRCANSYSGTSGKARRTRDKYRKKWTQHVKDDPAVKTWFLALSPAEQIASFNDPGRRQKTFPRV